jgi:hypothetical protein
LIKLERDGAKLTWYASDDGRSKWRELRSYNILDFYKTKNLPQVFAFAGRFGVAPGGGVLLLNNDRIGHFFSEAEIGAGASADWTSIFSY